MIRVERQNNLMALVIEQTSSEELVQEPCKTLKFFAVIFTESLAFFTKVAFLCQTLHCTFQRALVSILLIHCELFYSSFTLFNFHTLDLYLT